MPSLSSSLQLLGFRSSLLVQCGSHSWTAYALPPWVSSEISEYSIPKYKMDLPYKFDYGNGSMDNQWLQFPIGEELLFLRRFGHH